jgi:glycosyltransferase involved in cell wall biosynthesis
MTYPSSSLIIATYNWVNALDLCLKSVLNQSIYPNEIIIADDGSKDETKKIIEYYKGISKIPIIHVWQEDNGFKLAEIRNKAIAKSSNPYIIQIDGDLILNKNFIKDHLMFSEKGVYLFGSRVNIQKTLLPELYKTKRISFNFFSKGIKKRFRTLRIPLLMSLNKPKCSISTKLRGCNISFWKDDFIKINGYNENFVGWGGEDSEMIQRLHNIGIKGKRLKFSGIVYHIFHNEQSKKNLENNKDLERQTNSKQTLFIEKGINQHL